MITDDMRYIDPITGKYSPLRVGDFYRIYRTEYREYVMFEYLGLFDRISDVPNKPGIFILKGEKDQYFVKELDVEAYEKAMEELNNNNNKVSKSKTDLLDCDVKVTDDVLTIMVKRMLEGMTLDEFKKLFDNVTECNNMKGAIFGPNDLSWKRFCEMMIKLNCHYNLTVYMNDRVISNKEEK